MQLTRLALSDYRCHSALDAQCAPGLNFFVGENGSGKTSLLDAVFSLSRGHGISGVTSEVIRRGQQTALVVGHMDTRSGALRVAVQRSKAGLTLRLGQESQPTLRQLALAVPILLMDPSAHQLVDESAGHRRRFLDWGVFHVEHQFPETWKRFQLALRQRNAALRAGNHGQAHAFNDALVAHGDKLNQARRRIIDMLAPIWQRRVQALLGEDWSVQLELKPGWSGAEGPEGLRTALRQQQDREQALGYTLVGPHRADLKLTALGRVVRQQLSRGQQKMLLLALHLAMADCVEQQTLESPILLCDDFASELGTEYQTVGLQQIAESGFQCLMTGLQQPQEREGLSRVFHVEQGRLELLES